METIVSVATGKNTCSRSAREIGIGIGTTTAIIGGTVIAAASLMEHG
jgi:hypothetical protein